MTNATPRQRLICSVVAVVFLATSSGCQTAKPLPASEGGTTQAEAPPVRLTASEEQMRKDDTRFYETVLGGAVAGALTASALCVAAKLLTGGKKVGEAAVTCAVIGLVVGGVDGYVVGKREKATRDKISELQAATDEVRKDNQNLQTFLDSSNIVLAEGKARLATLRSDLTAKRVSAAQADQARKREEENIASMNRTLKNARGARDVYASAAPKFNGTPQQKRDLDAEITRMNNQVAQLEKNIADYNEALAVSKA